jgi:assimilatory nitrate reductase catalytic subunit
MIPLTYQPPAETPGGDFPFRLTSGRVVYQYLSGNQTRRLGFLNSQAPEPWVEIHPNAAEPLGVKTQDIVRVRTARGSMDLRALVTPTIRPDTLFIPFHYGHRQAVNQLTNSAVEPTVKIPEFKCCAARIDKVGSSPTAELVSATENLTPANAPAMFPYQVGPAPARHGGDH